MRRYTRQTISLFENISPKLNERICRVLGLYDSALTQLRMTMDFIIRYDAGFKLIDCILVLKKDCVEAR